MKIAILGADASDTRQLRQALQLALSASDIDSPPAEISETTALMALLQQDVQQPVHGLAAQATALLHGFDLLLVTGVPDSETALDKRLRALLVQLTMEFTVVYGEGPQRADCALQAIRHRQSRPARPETPATRWCWNCEKCSDPECEYRLFSALLPDASMRV